MGDICDISDCDRFMRSKTGKAHLDEIVAMLKGRTIVENRPSWSLMFSVSEESPVPKDKIEKTLSPFLQMWSA